MCYRKNHLQYTLKEDSYYVKKADMTLEYLAWELGFLGERVRRIEQHIERRQLRDAELHNMRIQHRLCDEDFKAHIAPDDDQNGNAYPAYLDDDLFARGPRASARRIQRQIMRERFYSYCDAEGEENDQEE